MEHYTPKHRKPVKAELLSGQVKSDIRNLVAAVALTSTLFPISAEAPPRHTYRVVSAIPSEQLPKIEGAALLPFVTLPYSNVEDFYPNHPVRAETTRKDGDYCKVVDVPLPRHFEDSEIMKGAQTEFAISTEEFIDAQRQMEEVKSIADAQEIMTLLLGKLGIKTVYDAKVYGKYWATDTDRPGALDEYKLGMLAHIESLTLMPREMLSYAKTVNFVNAKTIDEGADGVYFFSKKKKPDIVLTVPGANKATFIHEEAHALHEEGCDKFEDAELEKQFQAANEYLNTNENTKELETRLETQEGEGNITDQEKAAYEQQGKNSGFPNTYSRTNLAELLAVETTVMVLDGGYIPKASDSMDDRESAALFREMIVERLQKAMPHTDVPAWLAYMNTYRDSLPSKVNPELITRYRISPLDGNIEVYEKIKNKSIATFAPAIEIRSGEIDVPPKYVYASTLVESGLVSIAINTPNGQSNTTQLMIAAAQEYLKDLPGSKDKEIDISTVYEGKVVVVSLY